MPKRQVLKAAFALGLVALCLTRSTESATLEIGSPAPDFELQSRDGQRFRLSDFKGNVVFLNFWATWCPPCIQEFPAMEMLNRKLRTKLFTMIAVSVDDSWLKIDDFLKLLNQPPSFLILLDSSRTVAGNYGTEKFPETYLINKEGILVEKFVGIRPWTDPKILALIEKYL